MKLCASFHCKKDYLDEIRYPISMLDTVFEHMVEKPNKLYIVEVKNVSDQNLPIEKIKKLVEEGTTNLIIDCYRREDLMHLTLVHHLPNCIYHYPISNYTELWFFLHLKPYAVVISEPLTFDILNVRTIVEEQSPDDRRIQIRVFPALGMPSAFAALNTTEDDGMRHFWVAPQHTPIYEPYIDTFELFDSDENRENTLVDLYHKQECAWDLTILLKHCKAALLPDLIDEDFVHRRLTCNQRCMRHGYSCHICQTEAQLINTLVAKRL